MLQGIWKSYIMVKNKTIIGLKCITFNFKVKNELLLKIRL